MANIELITDLPTDTADADTLIPIDPDQQGALKKAELQNVDVSLFNNDANYTSDGDNISTFTNDAGYTTTSEDVTNFDGSTGTAGQYLQTDGTNLAFSDIPSTSGYERIASKKFTSSSSGVTFNNIDGYTGYRVAYFRVVAGSNIFIKLNGESFNTDGETVWAYETTTETKNSSDSIVMPSGTNANDNAIGYVDLGVVYDGEYSRLSASGIASTSRVSNGAVTVGSNRGYYSSDILPITSISITSSSNFTNGLVVLFGLKE